jgi:hypothetical protein
MPPTSARVRAPVRLSRFPNKWSLFPFTPMLVDHLVERIPFAARAGAEDGQHAVPKRELDAAIDLRPPRTERAVISDHIRGDQPRNQARACANPETDRTAGFRQCH